MSPRTIVVLGGALSGPTAAARARETDEHARIVLVERSRRVSYALCGLAYHLSGEVGSLDALDRERADFFEQVYRIEVWTEAEATALDAPRRTVTVQRGGKAEALAYDALVFALGAASRLPDLPGLEGTNVRPLRTIDDLEALASALRAGQRRVTVLGGGPIGVEAADGLVRGGAEVTLVERGPTLLPRFGRQPSAAARRALAGRARVHCGATVTGVETTGGAVTQLRLSTGEVVATDFVVAAIGLIPRTELLAGAGATLAADGTVVVDDRAQTSLPGVFACGVCVSAPQAVTGVPTWSPQGALADKTAQVAGANAAAGDARLAPALGSMLVRVVDTTVGRTGLSAAEADAHLGRASVGVTTVHASSHDPYFPGAAPLLLRLLWDRRNGRILGAEAAGTAGVDKRVDAAAAAVAGGLTVEDLAALDLGYAPPYASARDPLNVAAAVAAAERAGLAAPVMPRVLHERCARAEALTLLDVRSAAERGTGPGLAGALAVPLEELRARAGALDATRPVVAFDGTGRRGYLAARLLAQHGLRGASYLAGGLASWTLLGLPTEGGAA
ncbi:MAG TPA: FAD-dependent oxidoreductase [Myxococcota bacterium]|jgi:NADPH-dependent 2,4-dienoyl-CoA reductase/sulfur reductase-like enzyme/rhodanese-related sulfurtransferase|nr:FAD-dependent oxidoreductase [Myxococcota bacterium]